MNANIPLRLVNMQRFPLPMASLLLGPVHTYPSLNALQPRTIGRWKSVACPYLLDGIAATALYLQLAGWDETTTLPFLPLCRNPRTMEAECCPIAEARNTKVGMLSPLTFLLMPPSYLP